MESRALFVLARGDSRMYRNLEGKSIFADLADRVVVFVDETHVDGFRGLEGASDFEIVRWSNHDAVVQTALEVAKRYPVAGVATLDEELVDLAARLRQKLELPGMLPEAATRFRDKTAMKKVLSLAGVRVPEFAPCSDRVGVTRLLDRSGRLVVKPNRGQGSRGVAFIGSLAELDAWYLACKDVSEHEAEEFVEGVLYHVNAIVRRGTPILTASAPYIPGMGNIDFNSGRPFVTVIEDDPDLRSSLTQFSDRVVKALGLENGVTHLECFVTPAREVVFCEIGARPGGGGIVWMIEAQYGVNFGRAALLLEAGRGDEISVSKASIQGVSGLIGFRSAHSAFIHQAAKETDFPESWIHVRSVDVGNGGFKAASAHCTDFWGLLVFSSGNRAEFDTRLEALKSRFAEALRIEQV